MKKQAALCACCLLPHRRLRDSVEEERMKKQTKWKIMLGLGVLPLVAPVLLGIYEVVMDAGIGFPGAAGPMEKILEIIVLYSFLYWPTYLIGLGLILFAAAKLRK